VYFGDYLAKAWIKTTDMAESTDNVGEDDLTDRICEGERSRCSIMTESPEAAEALLYRWLHEDSSVT
jgi:hypothetical protein